MSNHTTNPYGRFIKFDRRAGQIIEMPAECDRLTKDYNGLLKILCDKGAIYETALLIAKLESKNLISIKGN